MKSFSDYTSTIKPSILIVGPPGSGKTTLGAMMGTPLVVELDHNIDGPFNFLRSKNYPCKARVIQPLLDSSGQLLSRVKRWAAMNTAIISALKSDPEIDTLIIDGLTSYTNIAMDEVRRQLNISMGDLVNGQPDAPFSQPAWGAFYKLTVEWINKLKSLGKVLIVTAHEDIRKEEGTDVFKRFINIPGGAKNDLSGMFTEVWATRVTMIGTGEKAAYDYQISTVGTGAASALGLKSALQLANNHKVDFIELNQKIYGSQTS